MMKLAPRSIETNGDLHFSQYWDGGISQNFIYTLYIFQIIN